MAPKKTQKAPAAPKKIDAVHIDGTAYEMKNVAPEQLKAWQDACLAAFPTGETKKYQVVYCDPPWSYWEMGPIHGLPKYPTVPLADLKKLPVGRIADSTSVCFMWATNPLLKQAFELMEAWGFQYKTIFKVWLKRTAGGSPVIGTGWYTRPSVELLLVGTRGGGYMSWKTTCSEPQEHPSLRRIHSEKPPEIRDSVRDFFNVPNRIELFARQQAPAWDAWGLEVPGGFYAAAQLPPAAQLPDPPAAQLPDPPAAQLPDALPEVLPL